MIRYIFRYNHCITALLFCVLQVAGIDAFGQETIVSRDSTFTREAPKAKSRRNREAKDALIEASQERSLELLSDSTFNANVDSVFSLAKEKAALVDSIDLHNKKKLKDMESAYVPPLQRDTVVPPISPNIWIPNPANATWYAVVFPGCGHIYKRKYWKLPILYGGLAGCAYALGWKGRMYKYDY